MYTITGVVYAVFILTNSILIFFGQNIWSYFFTSLLFSLIYVVVIALLSSLFMSMAKVEGSGESAMMFLIIFYHPFALLLVMGVKWIVSKI